VEILQDSQPASGASRESTEASTRIVLNFQHGRLHAFNRCREYAPRAINPVPRNLGQSVKSSLSRQSCVWNLAKVHYSCFVVDEHRLIAWAVVRLATGERCWRLHQAQNAEATSFSTLSKTLTVEHRRRANVSKTRSRNEQWHKKPPGTEMRTARRFFAPLMRYGFSGRRRVSRG
jgi:hypothetical protein